LVALVSDPHGVPAGTPSQASLLASGSLVQQLSQVTGLLMMFVILTVLARRLSLTELGVYGLLSSLAGYLLVFQNGVAGAALRGMSRAKDAGERARAFSTAGALYAVAGLGTGVLVALVGVVVALALELSPGLREQAILGALLLGLITAIGFPATVFRDALRASQMFVLAAGIEMVGLVIYAALVLGLVYGGAGLALLIGASGAIPLLAGIGCAAAVRAQRLPFRLRASDVDRGQAREFMGLAGYLSAAELAGVVIYALDRVILGLFQSAATVGLYEGPVRLHNLLRALNGALGITVLPTASRYLAEGDDRRLLELVVRGARYTLAIVVPLTVTLMVLAGPILEVWLGREFRAGATALAILVSYWLVSASLGVVNPLLVAAGRARDIARYAWGVALLNLGMSLALTPWIGLEGVAIGTTVPYLLAFPLVLRLLTDTTPVRIADLARAAWVPAYTTGLALATALVVARLVIDLDSVPEVLLTAFTGVLGYWAAFYSLWLAREERGLVREVAGSFLGLGRAR